MPRDTHHLTPTSSRTGNEGGSEHATKAAPAGARAAANAKVMSKPSRPPNAPTVFHSATATPMPPRSPQAELSPPRVLRRVAKGETEGEKGQGEREPRAGALVLVPTPIGNLEDITLRALRTLREATLVLAEDTRTARRLLNHYGIAARLQSYTEHNHAARLPDVLAALAEGDVALVSEAGMPAINDPGRALVAAVVEAGFTATALPGASAVPLAVALSGLAGGSFTYLGFLPHGAGERRALLRREGGSGHALVLFETPHRLRAALADIAAVLGERPLCVCRELTKLHEEVFRGTASSALAHFPEPRGECTLVIAPADVATADTAALTAFVAEQRAAGASARDAVAATMARFGVSRRLAYAAWEAGKDA